jgi:hypothetical protein
MIADDLRRQADIFLDLVDLQAKIGRDPGERVPREPRAENGAAARNGEMRSAMPAFLERTTTGRPAVRDRDEG